jgi:histidine phosphotransfer protein HptB
MHPSQRTVFHGAVYSEFADDPDFEELLQLFVDSLPEKRNHLKRSMQNGNLAELARQGHQLKGAGGGYGFYGLTEVAADLESACKTDDAELVGEAVERLIGYLDRIKA